MNHYDLWTEASRDHEAETQAHNLEMAKHASGDLWAFLAQAASPEEYADRAALAADNITAVTAAYDVPLDAIMNVFDHRFALLMEARDNPFADDSQDSSGDDSSESKDDSSSDSDDDDDSHDDSDDNGDGNDDDSDSDEDSDDTGDGDDEDDDSDDSSSDSDQDQGSSDDSDDDSGSAPPWASKFSTLAARIHAGEDPLTWGGAAPFARSSARVHAADGADPVTDTNVPQDSSADPASGTPDTPAPDAPAPVPGMDGGIAETTKPRQMPEGGGMDNGSTPPGMDMDNSVTDEFDPDLNGGDIQQGADANLPGEPDTGSDKIAAITAEVRRYNPTLSADQAHKVAQRVYDTYLSKHAEDVNPLLYGDRAPVGDGPISGPLKNWSPADMKPPKIPGMPSATPGAPGGETPKPSGAPELPAGGSGAAGELAAGEGAAAELLPLLAL